MEEAYIENDEAEGKEEVNTENGEANDSGFLEDADLCGDGASIRLGDVVGVWFDSHNTYYIGKL